MPAKNAAVVDARRRRLREWIAAHHGGVQKDFIARTGINQGELSALLKNKSFGEVKALAIETAAGMPAGYLVTPLEPTAALSQPARPDRATLRSSIDVVQRIKENHEFSVGDWDEAEAIIVAYDTLCSGSGPVLAAMEVMRYAGAMGGGYGAVKHVHKDRDRQSRG